MKQTLDNLKINDILYTKDGRKCGNCVVVSIDLDHIVQMHGYDIDYPTIQVISDYGNLVTWRLSMSNLSKQFYKHTGVADSTHKYHNYRENYPEEFL